MDIILYRYIMFGRGIPSTDFLRKIPVERRTISRAEWWGKFSLKTGIFRKYPFQTWYICIQFHVWLFEMGWGYGEKWHFQ